MAVTATTALAIAAIAGTLTTGVVSASASREQGRSAVRAGQVNAAQAKLEATTEETERKRRLTDAIAAQRALTGAAGIEESGSPLTVLQEDIRREEIGAERLQFQSELGQLTARARGQVQKRAANVRATTSLLGAASSAANLGSSLTAPAPTTTGN